LKHQQNPFAWHFVPRQPPWPFRDNQIGRWRLQVSAPTSGGALIGARLSPRDNPCWPYP